MSIPKWFWVYIKNWTCLKNLSMLKPNFEEADGLGISEKCLVCFLFALTSWTLFSSRTKVFNWSEVHLYRNNFLQNPYFSKNIDKMIFLWFVGVDPTAHLLSDQLNIPINLFWTSKSTNSSQWCSVLNFFGNLGCLVSKTGIQNYIDYIALWLRLNYYTPKMRGHR